MKRRDQIELAKAWNELKTDVVVLDKFITRVSLRGTHDSGVRRTKKTPNDAEVGTPPPYYADETGETAIRELMPDATYRDIITMATKVHEALNLAKKVLDVAPADVAERARRVVPDCLACGDPCHGGVRSGFDDKCRKRWDRMGRPDRFEFMLFIRNEKKSAVLDVP